MIWYLCKKAIILLVSLFCVVTGTFFLMKAIPGDPFADERITEEALKALHAYYGLDQPIWVQYLKYIKGYLSMDFGRSIVYAGRSVAQLISDGFPVSAQLGLQALCVAIPAGIFLGAWAALKRTRWQDNTAMVISTIGISVPNFVLATLLQYFIALKLHLLPVARWGTFAHSILPTIALAALPTAFIARLTRSNMVEVLQQDYIRTAAAKGIPLFRIAMRHGLRNAILPVISYLGPVTAQILTGSFVVERIFAIPGLGEWLIHSIYNRDYPVIIGITVFYSTLLLVSIFFADIAYSMLDPRIKTVHKRDDHG
ncbi:MAG: oppB [Parachlamydiales bacterium]|nr:oppB [Parachlamydiales bacterium]